MLAFIIGSNVVSMNGIHFHSFLTLSRLHTLSFSEQLIRRLSKRHLSTATSRKGQWQHFLFKSVLNECQLWPQKALHLCKVSQVGSLPIACLLIEKLLCFASIL